MYIEKELDPSSHRIHRKSLKLMDNLSKKCHYQISQPILDYNSMFLVAQVSNVWCPFLNNFLSIVNVTKDFSIATI